MSDDVDPVLRSRASEEVGRAVIALIREEPFFGHLLSGINRRITNDTSTVRVSFRNGRPVLSVNPDYVINGLPIAGQRSAAVKQAVLSLLLDHRGRFDAAEMDAQIFAMASNVMVNQLVGDTWPLPADALGLESFDFPLPPDMTVEWYYRELWERRDEIPEEMKPDSSDFDDSDESERTDNSDGGDQDDPIAQHELSKAVRDARDRSGDDFAKVSGQIQDLVTAMIDDLEPSIDWRRVIRLFTSSSRRTKISNTLRRPSKRYGTYPGIKVKRLHRLAVIIDTSGSVSEDTFGEFFAEVRSIWRQGSHVTVIEADTVVRRSWEYRGDTPPSTSGRGGTRFDPALSWVADATPPFDAAVYFTDGLAAAPTVRPGCELLWALTGDGDDRALAGHRTVRLSS